MMISCSWPAFFMVHSCLPASMFLVKLEMVTIAKPSRFCQRMVMSFALDETLLTPCQASQKVDKHTNFQRATSLGDFALQPLHGGLTPQGWKRFKGPQRSPNIQGYPRFTTTTIGSLDVRLGAFLGKVRGLHLKWLQHPCALLCLQPHSTE